MSYGPLSVNNYNKTRSNFNIFFILGLGNEKQLVYYFFMIKFFDKDNLEVLELGEPKLILDKSTPLGLDFINAKEINFTIDDNATTYNKIRISVHQIGILILYLDEEKEVKIFNEIKVLNDQPLEEKIPSLIKIINTLIPYFGVFLIDKEFELINGLELANEFPIIFINKELTKEELKKKEASNIPSSFKGTLLKFKKDTINFIFYLFFPILLSTVTLLCMGFLKNNQSMYGIIFLLFIILFIGLISYNTYLIINDFKKLSIWDYLCITILTIIGVTLGTLFGFALIKNIVKLETPINNNTGIVVSVLVGIFGNIFAHIIALVINRFKK